MSQILAGKGGDEVHQQIPRRVVSLYWDRGRAHWGDEVGLGALVAGFKPGTAVKLKIYEVGDHETLVKEVSAKVESGGVVKGKYKVDFHDPDVKKHDRYDLFFVVEIDGKPWSSGDRCPLLLCDADPPEFSQ